MFVFFFFMCTPGNSSYIIREVTFRSILHNGINFKAFLEFYPSAIGVAVSHFSRLCVYVWVKVSVEERTFFLQVSFLKEITTFASKVACVFFCAHASFIK